MSGSLYAPASATETVDVKHYSGTLGITKVADLDSADHGDTITYTLKVTYVPGADGAAARNVVVSDDLCVGLTRQADAPGNNNNRLAGTETWVYTCTYVVPAHRNNEPDPVTNRATVTGENYERVALAPASATETVDVVHPSGSLSIVKTADKTMVKHGETINYTLAVKFTPSPGQGGSWARAIDVNDSGAPDSSVRASLALTAITGLSREKPGPTRAPSPLQAIGTSKMQSWTLATVSGEQRNPLAPLTQVSSEPFSVDFVHDVGDLTIVKTANKSSVKHGETITYTLVVTYSSADRAPARNVVITDNLCTTLTGPARKGAEQQ